MEIVVGEREMEWDLEDHRIVREEERLSIRMTAIMMRTRRVVDRRCLVDELALSCENNQHCVFHW